MGGSSEAKRLLPSEYSDVTRDFLGGVIAGGVKTACLHPIDTLTCRGQVGGAQLEILWPPSQWRHLYAGIAPAIVRSAGGMGIWLSMRNVLERNVPTVLQSDVRDWLVGMASTSATDVCTFWLDTLKKILQADGGSVMSLMQRLLRAEGGGVARLYRGYSPRFLMVAINGGLWNWVYVRVRELQALREE